MPNGQQQFNPNAPYQKPPTAFDPNAPYQKPDASAAAPNAAPASAWQEVKNWWNAPTPLRIPDGHGGWKELPGTDVSPKEHIGRAVKDASIVGAVGAPLGEIAAGRSLIPVAKAAGRMLIGSGIGSAGGSWLGGYAGEAFKNRQLGEEIGGTVGGLAGGVYGGLDRPVLGPWGSKYSIGKMIPSLARNPDLDAQEALGKLMNRGYRNIGAIDPREAELGAFMNRGYRPVGEGGSVTSRIGEPAESVAGTRSLVLSPEEAATEDRMQGIAKKRASERGMQFAGGMTPREGRSVPRYPTRFGVDEAPQPREVIKFGATAGLPPSSDEMLAAPSVEGGPPQRVGEGAAAVGLLTEPPHTIPEQVAQSNARLIQGMKDVIRNPHATPEEILGAKQRLREMGISQ